MKRWLIVGGLCLPVVLCAQEKVAAESATEPEARVIAHPQEVPALATYEQGQTSDVPSAEPNKESAAEPATEPIKEPAPSSAIPPVEPLKKVLPGRTGYAFDQPPILLRQRLFGLAHGVSLLAAACTALPEHAAATQTAFLAWHDQQAVAIEKVVSDLTAYYFGPQGGGGGGGGAAQWQDLTRALKLKERLDQSLGQFELGVACASLNQAITGPRYDLAALLQLEPLIALKIIAGEFVPPSVGAADRSAPAQPPPVKNAISAAPTEEKISPDDSAKPKSDEPINIHAP